MTSNNTSTRSGMGFTSWLTILFIALKLTGQITWPWVWVLSPIWISGLIVFALFIILLAIAIINEVRK
jgi:NADH:ubiquinone oxidoreductase subunit 3 (subunit A)